MQDDRYGKRFFSDSGCDEARLKAAIDEVRGSSKVPGLCTCSNFRGKFPESMP